MPTTPRTARQIVRREVLIGLFWGVGISVCVVPFELNYLCRRADGSIGPFISTTFANLERGPDGKFYSKTADQIEPASRGLYWYEQVAVGAQSAAPVVGIAALLGWLVGRAKAPLAARREAAMALQ